MKISSAEHYEMMDFFEKTHRDLRLDREAKAFWPAGRIYQSGETNSLFLAFRAGVAYGQSIEHLAVPEIRHD